MTIELAFNIALGLISTLFGFLIKTHSDRLKEERVELTKLREATQQELTNIKVEYLPRTESVRHYDSLSDQLTKITDKIDNLSEKLDRKVDK